MTYDLRLAAISNVVMLGSKGQFFIPGATFWTSTWILALAIVTHLLRALAFVIVVTLLLKSFFMLAPMHTFHATEYQVSNVSHANGWGSPGLWGKYKEMPWK